MRRALQTLIAGCALAAIAARAPAQEQEPRPGPTAQRPAPLVLGILVEGERRYTESQIVSALGQRLQAPLDREALRRGIETLWRTLHARAEVAEREVPGGIELRVTVEEMNVDLEPRFVGNVEFDVETLRRWAQLEDRGELYLYQAERVRQRILEGYRREGHAFAEVALVRRGPDSGPDATGALPDVIFEIREGPHVSVADVIVRGNVTMPARGALWWKDGLQQLASTQLGGPWLFDWDGSDYVQEALDADLLAMREVYRDRGYLDAVVEIEDLAFSDDRTEVTIHVVVDEGRPYSVESLDVEAVDRVWNSQTQNWDETPADLLFPSAELLALCQLRAGKRYAGHVQELDAQALRERYGKEGYLSHPSLRADGFEFLTPRVAYDPARKTARVTYRLAQGRKRYVREILFAGTLHTRDRIVRREVDLMPGDVADLTRIRRSLTRITGTGYFSSGNRPLEHRDPIYTLRPAPDPAWVDVEYQVEEGEVVQVELQGGIDSNDGLVGRIALSMRNFDVAAPPDSLWSMFSDVYDKAAFHGAGQLIELAYMPGTVTNEARARFVEPDLFRSHLNRWRLELELAKRDREQDFYDEDRFEKKIRIGREIGRQLTLYLGYRHTDIEVSNLDPDDMPFPPSILQQVGENVITGPSLDFQYRDLDNFFNPREGTLAVWRNAYYGGPFGGDFTFVRSEFDLDVFILPGEGEELRSGFHVGVGLGIADAFGDTTETPYTERFFLGGTSSMRGWDYRGVGPSSGGNALGGETDVHGTLEYRIPLYSTVQPGTYKHVETFRLTLFSDVGVLDPEAWRIDLGEVRWSVGFGLGMITPIPVTLNFGFPLVEGDGDDTQVFSFQLFSLAF